MERLTEWVGSGPERKAIARQDRRDIGDKDCVTRLAAYEDTGLTPEEINAIKGEIEFDQMKGLKKLLQAERAGLLVVLPCKKGDTLWTYYNYPTTGIRKGVVTDVSTLNGKTVINTDAYGVLRESDIGKDVFLTREEAEAALEAAKTTKEEI